MARKSSKKLEVWGGLECSYNRVKDHYMDQLLYCGHYPRTADDIACIADLGVKALRYPVIWERLHPSPGHAIDWSGTETALHALQARNIATIAGLVHHGSGPRYADLLNPSFAPALASYAGQVARKFPWIEYYTPVNEPLTTARFTCLYGLWFPHRRSDQAFTQALVNQMKGVVLSMREIRKVNPDAKLVQTEDLAKVYSTPRLRYQADFENHRRWLTFDLLCGMVRRDHPLWDYFIRSGVREEALKFFVENPCPPDLIGVDYYATSERYLDERVERYPPHTRGHNHFEQYADVEAFRVRHDEPSGLSVLLKECWDRYRISIAVTEAHIHCHSDDQIRWFAEIRQACMALMDKGVDIRAITAWSLLGAFGWNTLLTKTNGDYESGVFDIRAGAPKATALAEYLKRIVQDPEYRHPVEDQQGWWRREDRFIFERYEEEALIADEARQDDCALRGDDV